MTQELKRLHSNLGLPESVLNSVASVAVMGLSEDADDSVISARAGEESISSMLKSFQSHADRVRSKKVEPAKNKVEEVADEVPSYFREYMESQEKIQKELRDELASLRSAKAVSEFNVMVDRVGKELGLEGSMLDLCRTGLSSDMDEVAVRNKLGASKKVLIDGGVKFEEKLSSQSIASRAQADLEEARAWVKSHSTKAEE